MVSRFSTKSDDIRTYGPIYPPQTIPITFIEPSLCPEHSLAYSSQIKLPSILWRAPCTRQSVRTVRALRSQITVLLYHQMGVAFEVVKSQLVKNYACSWSVQWYKKLREEKEEITQKEGSNDMVDGAARRKVKVRGIRESRVINRQIASSLKITLYPSQQALRSGWSNT